MQRIATADKKDGLAASNFATRATTDEDNGLLPPAALTADLVRRGRKLGSVKTRASAHPAEEVSPLANKALAGENTEQTLPEQEPREPDISSRMDWGTRETNPVVEPLDGRPNDSKAGLLLNDVIRFVTIFAAAYAVILAVLLAV